MLCPPCETVFSTEKTQGKDDAPGKGTIGHISLYLSQPMNVAGQTDHGYPQFLFCHLSQMIVHAAMGVLGPLGGEDLFPCSGQNRNGNPWFIRSIPNPQTPVNEALFEGEYLECCRRPGTSAAQADAFICRPG